MRSVPSPVNAPLWSRSAIIAGIGVVDRRRTVVAVGRWHDDNRRRVVALTLPPFMLAPFMAAPGMFPPLVLPPSLFSPITATPVVIGKGRRCRAQSEDGGQCSQGQSARSHDSLLHWMAP